MHQQKQDFWLTQYKTVKNTFLLTSLTYGYSIPSHQQFSSNLDFWVRLVVEE